VGWYVHDDASLLSWRGEEPWGAVFVAQFPDLESVTYLLHLSGTSVTRDEDELYVGEISSRFWHARTPKSLLLHALFISLPLSKIKIIFRYTSQETIKFKY
jgi:hypothetical protein